MQNKNIRLLRFAAAIAFFSLFGLARAIAQCATAPAQTCHIVYQYDAAGNRSALVKTGCVLDGGGGNAGRLHAPKNGNETEAVAFSAQIAPNPTNGQTTIQLQGMAADSAPLTCYLFDLQGRVIATTQLEKNATTLPLDLASYPAGMYIVMLRNSEQALWQGKVIRTN